MKYLKMFLGLTMFLIFSSTSFADIPKLINYQGKLTDSTGNAVSDGAYSLRFRIYDDSLSGNVLWEETDPVQVTKGLFTVLLGSTTSIPDSAFYSVDRWLGIKIGSDPEMTPRQRLVSVGYSFQSGQWTSSGNDIYRNTGNVGIGTTNPNEQLELTGNLRLPPSTASAGVIKVGQDRFIHNFGLDNFFAGVRAGNLYMTGFQNTASGVQAFVYNSTGYSNTVSGFQALFHNTTGHSNTASGVGALSSNTTGSYNTASGFRALNSNSTGNDNTASGHRALYSNTTGGHNTASGSLALYSNTTGGNNTAGGFEALSSNSTGVSNTAIGAYALNSNKTGNDNTAYGYGADVSDTNLTNATAIGANAIVGSSNSLVLGGTGTYAVYVGIGTTSPQGALDVNSTTGALIVPRMTTAQRDALTAANGMIIYNTTTNQFNFYENGAWVTK